jgi:hypothetical protein
MPTTVPDGRSSAPRDAVLRVGDRALGVTLHDNPAAADLLARLPLSLVLTDYGGQEKTAPLSGPLTMDGMPAGSSAEPLDLGYYAPGGVLVLYYADVAYYRGIARLGRIHAAVEDLRDLPDGVEATLEVAGDRPPEP